MQVYEAVDSAAFEFQDFRFAPELFDLQPRFRIKYLADQLLLIVRQYPFPDIYNHPAFGVEFSLSA